MAKKERERENSANGRKEAKKETTTTAGKVKQTRMKERINCLHARAAAATSSLPLHSSIGMQMQSLLLERSGLFLILELGGGGGFSLSLNDGTHDSLYLSAGGQPTKQQHT